MTLTLNEEYKEDIAKNFLNISLHFKTFLNETRSQNKDVVALIMKVTLKANENKFIEHNFRRFLRILATSDFLKKKIDYFISTELYKSFDLEIFPLLFSFFKILFDTIPGLVYDILYPRIQNISLMIENMSHQRNDFGYEILKEIEVFKEFAKSCSPYMKNSRKEIIDESINPPDDFRQLSIYPTKKDLLEMNKFDVFLRRNKVKGVYETVDDYLDIQFRLMREDFIQPLRDGLIHYMSANEEKNFSVRIYENVYVVHSLPSQRNGIIHTLKFDISKLQGIKWEDSKRFLHGSLLCLSNDHFQSLLFATIINRDVNDLKHGLLSVKFDLIDPDEDKKYVLLESMNLFESYKHVLIKLKQLTENNLAMKRYLVYAKKDINLPKFLLDNIENKYKVDEIYLQPGIKDSIWPTPDQLLMDNSQFQAFKNALTKELTIIQGPPGTGKTYIGLKICKTLLENVQKNNDKFGPILIVCYTNHALDQFLEGIANFTKKIVRVGSQSKSELMKDFNLTTIKSNSTLFMDNKFEFQKDINSMKRNFFNLRSISTLSKKFLFKLEKLEGYMLDRHAIYLRKNGLKNWLMGISQTNTLSKKDKEIERFLENIVKDVIRDEIKILSNEMMIIYESNDNSCDFISDKDIEVNYINAERLLDTDETDIKDLNLEFKRNCELVKSEMFDDDNNNSITSRNLIQTFLSIDDKMSKKEIDEIQLLQNIEISDRWKIYRYCKSEFIESINEKIKSIEQNYQEINEQLKEIYFEEDRRVMIEQDIIGMTTTGAARYGKVLSQIKCKIIIVEEAAEVLESHIIGSLNDGCEHLILIGDHKQLKPSPAVYELAKRYNLDLSLFERLINNGLSYTTLTIQHRMRPEIAEIMKIIYTNLENHISVYDYPDVPGVRTNLFFLDHSEPEGLNKERMSYYNTYEALFIMRFCLYLIKNGIEKSRITVLTLYSGQMYVLRKNMDRKLFEGVRICVVDNYQGEENDIILISLVRSNEDEKIGFLNIENRICVSLSRAKHGLFVFGNFNILGKQSALWKTICSRLKFQNSIGSSLTVFCQNHPEKEHKISNPNDFNQCPEGCCNAICNERLDCGHACKMYCHFLDKTHALYKCKESCIKSCKNDHPCQLKCYQFCGNCLVKVIKTFPICKHEKEIFCFQENEEINCIVLVDRKCDKCGEKNKFPCFATPVCMEKCKSLCPNGHKCQAVCNKDCSKCDIKIKHELPCGHSCYIQCSTKISKEYLKEKALECKKRCLRKCTLGHPCKSKCYLKCNDCLERVFKLIPGCLHEIKIECCIDPDSSMCEADCDYSLPCGHKLIRRCNKSLERFERELFNHKCEEACNSKCLNGHICPLKCWESCKICQIRTNKIIPGCNHSQVMPCNEEPTSKICKNPCNNILSCGHKCLRLCKDKCGSCLYEFTESCWRCGKINKRKCSDRNLDCSYKCFPLLGCSHKCQGTCSSCNDGRLHISCAETFKDQLICSHSINTKCYLENDICLESCLQECNHKKCLKKCYEECNQCEEPCLWKCKHYECTNRCYQFCNRPFCNEKCSEKVTCVNCKSKFSCYGVCGEICDNRCTKCNPFFNGMKTNNLGNKKFITLRTCTHTFECDELDKRMDVSKGVVEIKLKKCPICSTVIKNNSCFRFSNILKLISLDVRRVQMFYNYGHQSNLQNAILEKFSLSKELCHIYDCLQIDNYFLTAKDASKILPNDFLDKTIVKEIEISNFDFVKWDIALDLAHEVYQCFYEYLIERNDGKESEYIRKSLITLLNWMNPSQRLFNYFEIEQFLSEFNRLHILMVISKENCESVSFDDKSKFFDELKKIKKFSGKTVENFHNKLLKSINTNSTSNLKSFHQLILKNKQINKLHKGQWFKCQKGHYSMTDRKCEKCLKNH